MTCARNNCCPRSSSFLRRTIIASCRSLDSFSAFIRLSSAGVSFGILLYWPCVSWMFGGFLWFTASPSMMVRNQVITRRNPLCAAFCAASLFFAVFRIVSYISECLRLLIVSELIVTPVVPAPPTWPCAILMFARRFTPLVVIWTCCVDVEGVAGGEVPSTPVGEVTSAWPGTPLGFPPSLRFQRSKHSQGVRLSIEIVTRAELKESATRVQLEGYFSTRDPRRASSEGLHA